MTSRKNFLADVIVTAVEGGIGYWSEVRGYHWSDEFAEVCIRETDPDENPEGVWRGLEMKDIKHAISKIVNGRTSLNEYSVKEIAGASALNDSGDIDSDLADCIVQVALFGDVKYG